MKAKMKASASNGGSRVLKSDVSSRVVLTKTTREESTKMNAKNITKSVKSDLKILKKFSFC